MHSTCKSLRIWRFSHQTVNQTTSQTCLKQDRPHLNVHPFRTSARRHHADIAGELSFKAAECLMFGQRVADDDAESVRYKKWQTEAKPSSKLGFGRAEQYCGRADDICTREAIVDFGNFPWIRHLVGLLTLFVILDCPKLPQSTSVFFPPLDFLLREQFSTAHKLLRNVPDWQIKIWRVLNVRLSAWNTIALSEGIHMA